MERGACIIEVRRLAKYFGRVSALRSLDLTVRQGEFVALFGRNGAGKTTFLRILAGLARPSFGWVQIMASEGGRPQAMRARMGYLSHSTALYADLTAFENLRFYATLMDMSTCEEDLVRRIGQVGLAGRESEPVRNYSRGMQQRLAIARAFLHNPDVLLLDEPFTGLDRTGAELLREYLSNAHKDGKTCLMAIHDAALGYRLADRLVVIEKGVAALDAATSSLSLEQFEEEYGTLTEDR